jgi:GTPase SAR1 family protein
VKGNGNQVIDQVTGGNVFNVAGNVNILPPKSIDQTTLQIDWLDRSRQLLEAQKYLTTNRLLNKSNRNLDDIHVPLGLIERKERPKVKEEPSPEQGSQLYQTEYTETKRFEHEAFLANVVGKPAGGKHIAIIGEPGAGKTTILTKIGAWLIQQADQQPPAPLVVAWISLADVGDRRLQAYLRDEWLQKVCEDNFEAAWEDWKGLRQQGRVWLLLDGLDEMSGDALAAIHRDLGQAWAQNLRVVMTCRLNQWEASVGGNILTNSFDVYRTLDYSYQTSQGEDQVKEFISKWFADNEKVATQIRTELDAPGKERIKDLVKNPLRLTLLCASWEKDNQALPETQADLYRGFVNYLYNWKAKEFSDEVKLKRELDLALGELAKAGLNRQPINDGAVRRFRFTASEISELWADRSDTLLPTAKNLGWLNVVGEESGDAVYAFYHPTFQEYFAACNIDDWDYFLPRGHIDRPVPCQDEDKPTYRVFEQEWRQVILLWIGRKDKVLMDECKEKFIDKLTGFQQQEGDFYYYRAYCMAAICVSEFQSLRIQEISTKNMKLAFHELSKEEEEEEPSTYGFERLARDAIISTHQPTIDTLIRFIQQIDFYNLVDTVEFLCHFCNGDQTAIDYLSEFLKQPELKDSLRNDIEDVLTTIDEEEEDAYNSDFFQAALKDPSFYVHRNHIRRALEYTNTENKNAAIPLIDILQHELEDPLRNDIENVLNLIFEGNKNAIIFLTELLKCPRLHIYCIFCLSEALGQIDVGNKDAITFLTKILRHPDVVDGFQCSVSQALGQIDIGNKDAIHYLVQLLQKTDLEESLFRTATQVLGQIGIGNKDAINTLIQLLGQKCFPFDSLDALGRIGIGNENTINALILFLKCPDFDIFLKDKISETLEKNLTKPTSFFAIRQLKNYVQEQVYNSNFRQSDHYFRVIFHCAQTLSYPEFHTAWHQNSLPIIPSSPQDLDNN